MGFSAGLCVILILAPAYQGPPLPLAWFAWLWPTLTPTGQRRWTIPLSPSSRRIFDRSSRSIQNLLTDSFQRLPANPAHHLVIHWQCQYIPNRMALTGHFDSVPIDVDPSHNPARGWRMEACMPAALQSPGILGNPGRPQSHSLKPPRGPCPHFHMEPSEYRALRAKSKGHA